MAAAAAGLARGNCHAVRRETWPRLRNGLEELNWSHSSQQVARSQRPVSHKETDSVNKPREHGYRYFSSQALT